MKVRIKSGFILAAVMTGALVCYAKVRSAEVQWVDFDMKNIPEPKERPSGFYDYLYKGQLVEGTKRDLDIPRWVRLAAGHPKQAANVNALDEVPDSSWYTNRHHIHPMTIEQLVRGPNKNESPDFTNAVITKAKSAGVEPGFWLKDAAGASYLIKFDGVNYPNLQSAAETISTKILYAAGYNVPENYIAIIDPKTLIIGDAQVDDEKTGKKRPFTRDDLDLMLRKVARLPDGRCRVLASKKLPGKAKGPFPQLGLRADDPNDLIPHENRRELRGLRAIASWINDWDLKETQAMDMYVEEGGRKFLRHYLLDFGSSLGADDTPTDYYHGHQYGFDTKVMAKEIATLGVHEAPDEKHAHIVSSEIGNFTSDDFDPGHWKQTFPAIVFDNMTKEDAFWATRIILSFSEPELRSIVEAGQYSDPKSVDYMLRTLMERRQMVARYWLSKVDALSSFSVRPSTDGVVLNFQDLMVDNNLAHWDSTEYAYQVRGPRFKSEKRITGRPEIRVDRATLAAAIEHGHTDPVEVMIWTNRQGSITDPVKIYFDWSPNQDQFAIRRITRG
jgi:hypothetical protein